MSMFRKNPAAAIDKARTDLVKLESVIIEHRAKRAQQLLEADDLTTVAGIDAALEANQRAMAVCRERIEALSLEAHRQGRERQEEARQSAITTVITPKLSKIEALATAAEQSFVKFCDSYAKLQSAVKDINGSDWPVSVPRPRHDYYFSISEVERRLATALDRASRNGAKDGLSAVDGIGENVRNSAARWLGSLRSAPLPDAPADEVVAA